MAKAAASKKPPTKSQIFTNIAEKTDLSRKQVASVFEALSSEVKLAISSKGAGQFTIPDLCKVVVRIMPAKPKRKVRNPRTGEEQWADPKPKSRSVRVRPLKKLKDMLD
jgi:nucleoid DNA-binding protein